MTRRVTALVFTAAVFVAGCSSSASDEAEPAPVDEDPQAFCLRLRNAAGPTGGLTRLELSDPASIDATIVELRALEASAPTTIGEELTIVVDALDDLLAALETPDNRSPAEVIAEQTEALDAAGSAAEALESYSVATCGFDLGPPVTPTPSPESDEDLRPA